MPYSTFPKRHLLPEGMTLISAGLIALSFPPWDLGWLSWVALLPWLTAISRTRSLGGALMQGFWLSFFVGLLVAHWLATAAHTFLELSWPTSILLLIAFAATCAQPHWIVAAPALRWVMQRTRAPQHPVLAPVPWLGLALFCCGLEAVMPRLFDVGLGYALHEATNLRQLADLGGVAMLTCLVVLVNLLLWRSLQGLGRTSVSLAEHVIAGGLAVILIGSALAYGVARNREWADRIEHPESTLHATLVQGSIPNDIRLAWARGDDRAAERQLSTYMRLTESLIARDPRPELIVWPEATFPGIFQKPGSKPQLGRATKFDRQVLRLRTPILFGAYDMNEEDGNTLFNSMFAITPNYQRAGSMGFVQRYHKHVLLPFAETLPGVSDSQWIRETFPSLGFFGRGPGAEVWPVYTPSGVPVRVAPIICSEALSATHVIAGARKGSELIVNIGSDGWFGDGGEPEFHLAISTFRSIETRRPQLRAANTGISALILPNGEVVGASQWGTEAILDFEVPIGPPPETTMVRWGNWFGLTALAVGTVVLAARFASHVSPVD